MCLRGSGQGNEGTARGGKQSRTKENGNENEKEKGPNLGLVFSQWASSPSRTRKPDIWTQDSCVDHNRVVPRKAGFHGGENRARCIDMTPPRSVHTYEAAHHGHVGPSSKSSTREMRNRVDDPRNHRARRERDFPSLLSRRGSVYFPPIFGAYTREDRPNIRVTRSENQWGFIDCMWSTGIDTRLKSYTRRFLSFVFASLLIRVHVKFTTRRWSWIRGF